MSPTPVSPSTGLLGENLTTEYRYVGTIEPVPQHNTTIPPVDTIPLGRELIGQAS